MARRTHPPRSGVARAKAKDPQDKVRAAFDQWLDNGLHTMFDKVAEEPVPDELLRLIEDDREKKS